MSELISKVLQPYFESYSDLITKYDEYYEVGQNNESLTQDYIDTLDEGVDITQDETAQFFVGMTQDVYDETARISKEIDSVVSMLKNAPMRYEIRASRLAVIKKIEELELKQSEMNDLSKEIERKVSDYAKQEDVSEDIASIMLKTGDKAFRSKCLKLSEWEKELNAYRHELSILERLEREVTGTIMPSDKLDEIVNGNTPK